jgi:hypothetical protein
LQWFTPTPLPVCARVCTSEPENDNAGTADGGREQGERTDQGDADRAGETPKNYPGPEQGEGADQGGRLDKLAAALATLSPAERERLAAILTGHQG